MIFRTALLAGALCLAGCATADPEATAPAATSLAANGDEVTTASAEDDSDGRVCRRERKTGSRYSKKVCRSEADLAYGADAVQQEMIQGFYRRRKP
ncbi:MAG: hypothetical protein AAGD86_12820 [Pseudomonadota bacterium]